MAQQQQEKGRVVIVAVDGSVQAENAFKFYCDNIYKDGDECLVISKSENKMHYSPNITDDALKEYTEKAKEQFKKDEILTAAFVQKMRESKMKGNAITEYDTASPGEVIVQQARKMNAAMIVMGSRGLGKIRRTLMGSVSDYVVHHAPCPVVVCPEHQ